ncbi:hypothetical protein BHE74_00023550 [Ensete ventricosum]|nr:hypothetical protein BHE74_00023550 [Ensete ventricosum]
MSPNVEQFYPRAPLVAIEDSTVSDLYVELVATFDLKRRTCSNLAAEEVIGAARVYKNGDGLLFKESSNFHRLRVGVVDQRVHCIVGRLGLFLRGFIFEFEAFFRWFVVLILYWFNHEKSALFAAMFSAPRLRHGWLGSDPCPSYFVVQSFFSDSCEENRRHKSVRRLRKSVREKREEEEEEKKPLIPLGFRSRLRNQRILQPNNGPRSSLGIRPSLDDALGPRREFAERIEKLVGSTSEDH